MAARTTIIDRQNLFDIALQETGSIDTVFAIAVANGINITDEIPPGTELVIPEVEGNADVYRYYRANNLRPASGSIQATEIEILEGIDYWYIEMDFIVS